MYLFRRNSTSNFSLSISQTKFYPSFSQSPLPKINCSNTRAFGRRLRLLQTRNCPSKIPWHAQERYYKPDRFQEMGGSKVTSTRRSVTFVREVSDKQKSTSTWTATDALVLNERGVRIRWTICTLDRWDRGPE